MASAYETAAREFQRLATTLPSCTRATTRAERLHAMAAASAAQAAAARQLAGATDVGDDAPRPDPDALELRTDVLEALAEVESARYARRTRRPAQARLQLAAGMILDRLATRVTREADRPGLMREQLHSALVAAVGADAAQIVLVVADALPSAPPPRTPEPQRETLF
jgi:hypothetical protein